MPPSRADLLTLEIDKLSSSLDHQKFHIIRHILLSIRTRLRLALLERHYLYDYLQDAIALNDALTGKYGGIDALEYRATVTYGAASNSRKALGGLMMAAGIGLLVLSMLTMSLIIASTFPLTPFLLLVGGIAGAVVGIGFFRAGCQSGMASDLEKVTLTLTPALSRPHFKY